MWSITECWKSGKLCDSSKRIKSAVLGLVYAASGCIIAAGALNCGAATYPVRPAPPGRIQQQHIAVEESGSLAVHPLQGSWEVGVNGVGVVWRDQDSIRPLDVTSGSLEERILGVERGILFSPQGEYLAAIDAGGRPSLWHVQTSSQRRILDAQGQLLEGCSISEFGPNPLDLVLSCGGRKFIVDAATGLAWRSPSWRFAEGEYEVLRFNGSGTRFFLRCRDEKGEVTEVWRTKPRSLEGRVPGRFGVISWVDESSLAVRVPKQFPAAEPPSSPPHSMAPSGLPCNLPVDEQLAGVWSIQRATMLWSVPNAGIASASPDGRFVLIAKYEQRTVSWQVLESRSGALVASAPLSAGCGRWVWREGAEGGIALLGSERLLVWSKGTTAFKDIPSNPGQTATALCSSRTGDYLWAADALRAWSTPERAVNPGGLGFTSCSWSGAEDLVLLWDHDKFEVRDNQAVLARGHAGFQPFWIPSKGVVVVGLGRWLCLERATTRSSVCLTPAEKDRRTVLVGVRESGAQNISSIPSIAKSTLREAGTPPTDIENLKAGAYESDLLERFLGQ